MLQRRWITAPGRLAGQKLCAAAVLLLGLLALEARATDADGDGVHDEAPATVYATSFDTAGAGWNYGNWTRTNSTPANARTPDYYVYTNCVLLACNSTFTMTFTHSVSIPSTITFWVKSSSVVSNALSFYVDNGSALSFYASRYNYSKGSRRVEPGTHTFKWSVIPGATNGPYYLDDFSIDTLQDNCPAVSNWDQLNTDGDALGNECDDDDDNDGVLDANDNCPVTTNPDQLDTDSDTQGDACDGDDDNDGVADGADRFPLDSAEWYDTDNDGTGNNADNDDDNDGVNDVLDNCPLSFNLGADQTDTDSDGQGNLCDTDDDNDGTADNAEPYPLDATRNTADTGVLYSFYGDSANDLAGRDTRGAGDVNNDGYDDVIVGSYGDATNGSYAGRARIYSGANGTILYDLFGNDGEEFGIAVSGAGDVNNDGYDDVIVGADGVGGSNGAARVFSGATGGLLFTVNGTPGAQDYLGRAVSGAGDVNQDGFDDVIIGSDLDDTMASAAGKATVYSGANGAVLHTFYGQAANERLGSSVSHAGDVNADGYADVVVGACYSMTSGAFTGRVSVFSGLDGSVLHAFTSGLSTDYLGCSVSGGGDVNGDGYDDVVTGVRSSQTNSATARVYSGADGTVLFNLTRPYIGAGYHVGVIGDVNADGFADVAMADNSSYSSGVMGHVAVYSGADGSVLYVAAAGALVQAAGDVNADGYADFVVGNTSDNTYGTTAGVAHVMSGKALWHDADGDGQKDAADTDDDGDGVADTLDRYPSNAAATEDVDADRFPASWQAACGLACQANSGLVLDNCPSVSNASQSNVDGDTQGDACDTDDDNDGVTDGSDKFPLNAAAAADTDTDGFPNAWNVACDTACQAASGLVLDNCPLNANADQLNTDGDAQGNVCDLNDDNDPALDIAELFPLDAAEWLDSDRDGTGNTADTDDDNDGLPDTSDNCPEIAGGSQQDSDGDGKGDQCDLRVIAQRAIAAGESHTCAIDSNGGLRCWGRNQYGQLGNTTTTDSAVPVPVQGLDSGVVAVSAGRWHTCALTVGSVVKCWGYNTSDYAGVVTYSVFNTPVDVAGVSGGVRDMAAGWSNNCAAMVDGSVRCWGSGTSAADRPVAGISTAVGIEAGGLHRCAVSSAGAVQCWMTNSSGQLGNGTTAFSSAPVDAIGLGTGMSSVVAGYSHSCAVTNTGAMQCWGANGSGQLGNGSTVDALVPVAVQGLLGPVTLSAAGYAHSCAALRLGGLQCWGNNGAGQLGDGAFANRSVPNAVTGLPDKLVAIALGDNHSCALGDNGQLKCWGHNAHGQLGDGSTLVRTIPMQVNAAFHVADTDGDGQTNLVDADDDGDGVPDVVDVAPANAGNTVETGLPLDGGFKGSTLRDAVSVP